MKKLLLLLFLVPNLINPVYSKDVCGYRSGQGAYSCWDDSTTKWGDEAYAIQEKKWSEQIVDQDYSKSEGGCYDPSCRPTANTEEFVHENYSGGGYEPESQPYENAPNQQEKKSEQSNIANNNLDGTELLPAASGSGFAISKEGYILTNNHVIDGCQALNIHTNGKLVSARVIANDPINDLALLKGDFKPKTIFLLKSKTPKLLDDIYVAGYPFGFAISNSIKITKGIVSSLSGLGNNFSNMQIDAAIQPGNSGGPVLDKEGNVIGVAVAKLNIQAVYEDYGVIPENTNFAIKSSVAKNFAESNNIDLISKSSYKNKGLGEFISNGTYYLSCMMTIAKIKEMQTQKVFFPNIKH